MHFFGQIKTSSLIRQELELNLIKTSGVMIFRKTFLIFSVIFSYICNMLETQRIFVFAETFSPLCTNRKHVSNITQVQGIFVKANHPVALVTCFAYIYNNGLYTKTVRIRIQIILTVLNQIVIYIYIYIYNDWYHYSNFLPNKYMLDL